MIKPTQRDWEMARGIVAPWLHGSEEHRQWLRNIAEPDIASALAAAREEGRQEERARFRTAIKHQFPTQAHGDNGND